METTLKRQLYLYLLCGQIIKNHREIRSEILTVIKNVSFELFWSRALYAMPEDMEKVVLWLYGSNESTTISAKECILRTQSDYKSFTLSWPEFIASIEKELYLLQTRILPPESGLRRFLEGKKTDKLNKIDVWHFACFQMWLNLKWIYFQESKARSVSQNSDLSEEEKISFVDSELKTEMSLESDDNRIDELINDRLTLRSEEMKRCMALSRIMTEEDVSINHNDYEEVKKQIQEESEDSIKETILDITNSKNLDDFEKSFHFVIEQTKWAVNHDAANLGLLFQMLNSPFIDQETKTKIIELLSKEPWNRKTQVLYNICRKELPALKEYYFYTANDNLLSSLKNQIMWDKFGHRDSSCFKIPLTAQKTKMLYLLLRRNNCISPDTDIVNFCHIMTGLPIKGSTLSFPIKWIHKELQSLALFIGVLMDFNKEFGCANYKITWKTASKLFLFNDKCVNLKSTQYHQAVKKYESLISEINAILAPEQQS